MSNICLPLAAIDVVCPRPAIAGLLSNEEAKATRLVCWPTGGGNVVAAAVQGADPMGASSNVTVHLHVALVWGKCSRFK